MTGGRLFVIAAPSGAGKTSLVRELLAREPNLRVCVSHTTRKQRPNEVDGRDYHFVDAARYAALRDGGALLEHAEVYGRGYGTPRAPVEAALAEGRSIVLDIDVKGAEQVRRAMPDAVGIFVLPPGVDAIRDRLEARRTDSAEVIARRVAEAHEQLARCGDYAYLVWNDVLETAQAQLDAIVIAELSRATRRRRWVRTMSAGPA